MNKNLKRFEHKESVVTMHMNGMRYVIASSQSIRVDLVWVTESVRSKMGAALALFNQHKESILNCQHCTGDTSGVCCAYDLSKIR